MTTLGDFRPLRSESIDTIRARIDASINAGLDPTDPMWKDTTPAGFFWDHTQVMGFEAELLWDFGSTELPASVFISSSWGVYLDYWGEMLGVDRLPEVKATGEVTITNTGATSVVIATGTQVAALTADPDDDALTFLVTSGGATILTGDDATFAVEAEAVGSQYNVAVGAVTLVVSPISGTVTVTNEAAMTGGADVEVDAPYKERLLLEFRSSRGGGTMDDYTAESRARPVVGDVTVVRRPTGPGTVGLVLLDRSGQPLSVAAVAAEQAFWDTASRIDDVVTVSTPATLTTPVGLWVELDNGFTVSAEVGKTDLQELITAAAGSYMNALSPGGDVLRYRIAEAVMKVPGVYNIRKITVNALEADRAVSTAQVARLGVVTMTTAAP